MIYEFRTYALRPGTLPRFLELFGEALPGRERLSKLAAFWCTDVGHRNEVIHVWPYENALERSRIRAQAVKDGIWPPPTGELILTMKAEIFDAISPTVSFERTGGESIVEMSTYVLKPFTVGKINQRWSQTQLSPDRSGSLVGAFASDVGELNQWMRIWVYESQRDRALTKADTGLSAFEQWADAELVLQEETRLLMPARFPGIRRDPIGHS
jgi:hypothetical protein